MVMIIETLEKLIKLYISLHKLKINLIILIKKILEVPIIKLLKLFKIETSKNRFYIFSTNIFVIINLNFLIIIERKNLLEIVAYKNYLKN